MANKEYFLLFYLVRERERRKDLEIEIDRDGIVLNFI